MKIWCSLSFNFESHLYFNKFYNLKCSVLYLKLRLPYQFHFNISLSIFYLFGLHLNLNFTIAFVLFFEQMKDKKHVYAYSLNKLLKPYITRSTLSKPCLLLCVNASVWFKSCAWFALHTFQAVTANLSWGLKAVRREWIGWAGLWWQPSGRLKAHSDPIYEILSRDLCPATGLW